MERLPIMSCFATLEFSQWLKHPIMLHIMETYISVEDTAELAL